MTQKSQLIQGMKSIMEYFDIGKDQFFLFVGLGMPIRKINNRWYGHIANIENWFQKITIGPPVSIQNGDIPADFNDDTSEIPFQ